MKNQILLSYFVLTISLLFFSCEKENPDPVGPINTVIYTLTPENGGDEVVLSFQDLDGNDGNVPNISTNVLMSNTVYNSEIKLQNLPNDGTDLGTPKLTNFIDTEVKEKGTIYQFFFPSTINDLNISYKDEDDKGDPLGLMTQLTTGGIDTGIIFIILRYEPKKSARGVANGDITNAGGKTDIEVTFEIEVK